MKASLLFAAEAPAVDCLIPAAGLSSRMGDWKLMLPANDRGDTILDLSITHALSFCRLVVLVTGYRGKELAQRYHRHPRIKLVHNHGYNKGMFSSIRTGIKSTTMDYLFITHGDMPFIDRSVFAQLWQHRQKDTLFPVFADKTGHPVLLHKSSFQLIQQTPSPVKMKELLTSMPYRTITVNSPAIHLDIDTPAAWQKHLGKQLCSK